MDLKYLQTFQAVVQEGGFSKAALSLNYTQSTITFQMGQLEQELGVRLFDKIGRRMVLSQAGEQLVPYAADVLAAVDKMQEFSADLSNCRGDLHVGTAETMLCYKLTPILGEFHRRAPQARLFLQSLNCYRIRDQLLNGSLDLGLFYENVGGFGSQLSRVKLGEYDMVLLASPETAAEFADFITPDRQLPLPLVVGEPDCIFRQTIEEYLRQKSLLLGHNIELWSIPTIKKLVASGVGVSFLPRFAVAAELAAGQLVELPVSTELAAKRVRAVCAQHKNKWQSPLMKLFQGLCQEYLLEDNLIDGEAAVGADDLAGDETGRV